jgi:hypothetical protein
MEKLNLNFNDGDNILKSICWILSVLSWALFIVTGWISIKWLDGEPGIIWTIYKRTSQSSFDLNSSNYYPFQMQVSLIYIVFIFTMIVALAGFIIFMIKSTCKKDELVFDGMIGPWSKFHFFPLLCVSALFIIGECVDNPVPKNNSNHDEDMLIASLILTIIGLCSLIFIYIMTALNTEWYILLLLKKGTFSCLITLLWYNFCYLIYEVRNVDKPFDKGNNWAKGCGLAFSIIFGIGNLIFSYIFKDLVIAGMSTLIYVGLTAYYFSLGKGEIEDFNNYGDGIVDIIMMCFSLALLAFLIIKHKEDCLKS